MQHWKAIKTIDDLQKINIKANRDNEEDNRDKNIKGKIPTKIIRSQGFIYRRSHECLTKKMISSSSWQWFALTPGYGSDETYGPIVSTWKLKNELRLLNISTVDMRKQIISYANKINYNLTLWDINCNEQYSGGNGNRIVHDLLRPIIDNFGYHGTYINEEESDEDCEGASEIVLNSFGVQLLKKM